MNHQKLYTALSEFYLDVDHTPAMQAIVVRNIQAIGFSLPQVKDVNRAVVFPVLYGNLMSVAGVWTAFDEAWLTDKCHKQRERRDSWYGKLHIRLIGALLPGGAG